MVVLIRVRLSVYLGSRSAETIEIKGHQADENVIAVFERETKPQISFAQANFFSNKIDKILYELIHCNHSWLNYVEIN